MKTVSIPDMTPFAVKSLQDIKNLKITKVEWTSSSLFITLIDGQTCRAGTKYFWCESHIFDPFKKITRVEVIINKDEDLIIRINFYSGKETLVKVGTFDNSYVETFGLRVESFEIADDEQLIGCKLDEGQVGGCNSLSLFGVTWLKMKVRF
jgi:hypothetical protein